jgi:hypothetical protein
MIWLSFEEACKYLPPIAELYIRLVNRLPAVEYNIERNEQLLSRLRDRAKD